MRSLRQSVPASEIAARHEPILFAQVPRRRVHTEAEAADSRAVCRRDTPNHHQRDVMGLRAFLLMRQFFEGA